ncbi:MAG: YsnF/AvaK domain-containing protein [Chitinophagaceae bacterium]|nr:YsnF/AvaK domain-containing protein [Chitinophagaceae bacterium]
MANTVIGFFENAEEAQNAIEQLTGAGIARSNIDSASGMAGSDTTSTTMENNTSATSSNMGEKAGNAISRFFHSLFGGDSDEATRYSHVARSANTIITVHALSAKEAEQAADILDEAGAIDVNEKAAYYGYASDNTVTAKTDSGNNKGKIDRVEEELQVGKRSVQTGGVRVRSRIVERPVEEQLRLREERVTVDRSAVNRPLSKEDYAAFEEQHIELTEYAEVPVVNKEARVVEEIRIGKKATEREETVRDTVRKTEVDIENLEAKNSDASAARILEKH